MGKIAKKAFANFLLTNPRKNIIESKIEFKILFIQVDFCSKMNIKANTNRKDKLHRLIISNCEKLNC